jgi:carboxyl-terminal processing protease
MISTALTKRAGSITALLALLFVLAGCSGAEGLLEPKSWFSESTSAGSEPPADITRDMFVTGYEGVDSYYIDSVDLGALAMAGLGGLSQFDPKIAFTREPGQILLLYDDQSIRDFAVSDRTDADAWADLTADALAAASEQSVGLREASREDVYQAMFSRIVFHLDRFSRYANAHDAAENRALRDGFGGIGISIAVEDDNARILAVMHYTPAERAGLKADDIITQVNGKSLKGFDQESVIALLRGPVGSTVDLSLVRGTQPMERSITREHIVPETVAYQREGDVAYIRISSFNSETTQNLQRAIDNARGELGLKLKGLVLDLRGNPGGLLDQSVDVSDLFLKDGEIVSTQGRHPESHQFFEATAGDIGDGLPVVVLIDGNSASAAEIVAAALQDRSRAVVIGSNSYGKGSVQTVVRMPNDGELTLTWARFHAPSGYTLNELGVLPSICTNNGLHDATKLIAALRDGKLLPVPTDLRASINPSDTAGLHKLRAACPLRSSEGDDNLDLQLALQLLEDPALYERALHLAEPPGGYEMTASTTPDPVQQARP